MYFKRYFVEGLAHASYLFGADGEAAVVDPKRDVDDYLADAEREGLRIVAIFNSHPHADFASGFRELAQRTGARITSRTCAGEVRARRCQDGEHGVVGWLGRGGVARNSGHSPDSLSFLVH